MNEKHINKINNLSLFLKKSNLLKEASFLKSIFKHDLVSTAAPFTVLNPHNGRSKKVYDAILRDFLINAIGDDDFAQSLLTKIKATYKDSKQFVTLIPSVSTGASGVSGYKFIGQDKPASSQSFGTDFWTEPRGGTPLMDGKDQKKYVPDQWEQYIYINKDWETPGTSGTWGFSSPKYTYSGGVTDPEGDNINYKFQIEYAISININDWADDGWYLHIYNIDIQEGTDPVVAPLKNWCNQKCYNNYSDGTKEKKEIKAGTRHADSKGDPGECDFIPDVCKEPGNKNSADPADSCYSKWGSDKAKCVSYKEISHGSLLNGNYKGDGYNILEAVDNYYDTESPHPDYIIKDGTITKHNKRMESIVLSIMAIEPNIAKFPAGSLKHGSYKAMIVNLKNSNTEGAYDTWSSDAGNVLADIYAMLNHLKKKKRLDKSTLTILQSHFTSDFSTNQDLEASSYKYILDLHNNVAGKKYSGGSGSGSSSSKNLGFGDEY